MDFPLIKVEQRTTVDSDVASAEEYYVVVELRNTMVYIIGQILEPRQVYDVIETGKYNVVIV